MFRKAKDVRRRNTPIISTALQNTPRIVKTKHTGNIVWLTASNEGDTTLVYSGIGPIGIQLFQEQEVSGSWKFGSWDWCGTGTQSYTIEPGQVVQLMVLFWDNDKRERMLGAFAEKGTGRSGLVVLAVEPAGQTRAD